MIISFPFQHLTQRSGTVAIMMEQGSQRNF